MHGEGFFAQAFIYLAAAVIAVPLAKRLGLGSVLGYLLAGVVIGPWGLRLIGQEGQDVMHFAEFGVVMMLFLVGLELQPALLWRLRGPLFGLGGSQVAGTAFVGGAVALAFGLPWPTALAIGLVLAMSSTAIVLQSLGERGLMRTEGGQNAFAVLLFQDLAVIPMLALLPLLALHPALHSDAGHGPALLERLPGWGRALATLGAVAVVVVAGQLLVRPLLRAVARTRLRELFTAASLLLVIGIALLMSLVGLSPALGTFLAGVVLANSEYRHELESDLEPFKGLLLGVFFIAVGAGIDFGLISRQPAAVGGMVAAVVVLKAAVLFAVARIGGVGLHSASMLAFALAQGGEFCFVLLSFGVQNGVFTPALAGLLTAAVALSMALTPLVMMIEERTLRPRLARATRDGGREADAVGHRSPVLIAGYGNFGSTVGRFLQANGIQPVVLDNDGDHVEFLRQLGLRVYYGDASRPDLLHAAGAAEARLVVLATADTGKTLEIAHALQKHFPQARVLARARGRWEAYALLEAGVEHVYRDTLDTSLRLGVDALRHLGYRAHQVHRSAQSFRRRDDESTSLLVGLRHDRQQYFSSARARIRDLEEALLAEAQRPPETGDGAWDAETLRGEFGTLPAAAPVEPQGADRPGSGAI